MIILGWAGGGGVGLEGSIYEGRHALEMMGLGGPVVVG